MRYVLPMLLLLLFQGCAVKTIADPDATLNSDAAYVAVKSKLVNGDWLVSRGVHFTDNSVAFFTKSPLSHAAIYDAAKDEVIEAEGVGVHATPLADFLKKSGRVMVISPMWATPQNRPLAVREARSHIGKGYDFSGLVGLGTPSRYYCTELAIAAYAKFRKKRPDNPIPLVIAPSWMYHWGTVTYDSGPEPYSEKK